MDSSGCGFERAPLSPIDLLVGRSSDCLRANGSPLTPLATSATLLGMRDIFFSFASASAGVSFVALGGERS